MSQDAYLEVNASQAPAIELLKSMGYAYISPANCELQRGSRYHVLLKDVLRGQLRRLNRYSYAGVENEFSAANIERAMDDLDEPLADGLVRTSEKIYDALLLGRSYQEPVGEGKLLSFNLKYIDWDDFGNNVFHVTEELKHQIVFVPKWRPSCHIYHELLFSFVFLFLSMKRKSRQQIITRKQSEEAFHVLGRLYAVPAGQSLDSWYNRTWLWPFPPLALPFGHR